MRSHAGATQLIKSRACSVFGAVHPPKISAATQQFDELEDDELLELDDDELELELELEELRLDDEELDELELEELDEKLLDELEEMDDELDDDETAFSARAVHAQHSEEDELELEEDEELAIRNTPPLGM